METIFILLIDLCHFVKICLFCEFFLSFKRKINPFKYYKSCLLILSVSFILNKLEFSDNLIVPILGSLLYVIVIFVTLYFCYDEKLNRLMFSSIWMILISSILDEMSSVLIETILNIKNYENNVLCRGIAAVLSLFIVFIVGKVVQKKNRYGLKIVKTRNIFLFIILAMIDMVVLLGLSSYVTPELANIESVIFKVAYIFMIIGIFIQLAAVIILIVSRNEHQQNEMIVRKFLDEQTEHYKYLEQKEKETKKFRHDLKSHIYMLKTFVDNKDYEHFDEYFNVINEHVDKLGNKISVNNDIVDAIINRYYVEAKKHGIHMKVKGHFPKECSIDAYDLCTIFSNLLSNALEASREADKKEIEVSCMFRDNREIIIIISNYYNSLIKDEKGKLITKKKDKEIHGLGLENIIEYVEKNHGLINISNENNQFVVTVILKSNKFGAPDIGVGKYENSNC